MPHANARLEALLVGQELWRDKRAAGDALLVTAARVDGWAVSNVRKGTTRNVWELSVVATWSGTRGGVATELEVTFPGLEHDTLSAAENPSGALPPPAVEVRGAGDGLVTSKVCGKDGIVVERVTGEVVPERAMKTNEMFLKLVTKKGLPLVEAAARALLAELAAYGQQPGAVAAAGEPEAPSVPETGGEGGEEAGGTAALAAE